MGNYKLVSKHISTIVAGDAILHNGEIRTVTNRNIRRCEFMGITIFGDSYHLGYKMVQVVSYIKPF